jgi:AcrR family transcriptional regulator
LRRCCESLYTVWTVYFKRSSAVHKIHLGRPSSRERILDAAAELVAEIGAGRLTLDAVAERAKLSKGGLLYHFPSKQALLRGMIDRMIERALADKERLRKGFADTRNLDARVSVAAYLEGACGRPDPVTKGLIAALSEDPSLLASLRGIVAEHWRSVKQNAEDPAASIIAWLAIEGLRSLELHDLSPIDDADQQRIAEALTRLLDRGIA